LLLSFSFFTAGGGALLHSAAAHGSTMPIAVVVIATLAAAFRWVRTQTNRHRPLEFEDELPDSTYGLHLNS
jgi:Flp pilus assembly protein TadB